MVEFIEYLFHHQFVMDGVEDYWWCDGGRLKSFLIFSLGVMISIFNFEGMKFNSQDFILYFG